MVGFRRFELPEQATLYNTQSNMTNIMKNIRALAFLMEQNHNVKCLFFSRFREMSNHFKAE